MTQTLSLLAPGTYTVVPDDSVARFSVRHVPMQTVRGTLGPVSGTIEVDAHGRVTARGTVPAASFSTGAAERDHALRGLLSDDGLAPELIIEVDTILDAAIDGTLQIRGATAPVTFHVEPMGDDVLQVSCSFDRRSVGVRWPMPADKGVGRTVDIELGLTLRRT
jgi:polyisoprenoid-binding protein YceI